MQVYVGKRAGFCMGVRRALQKTLEASGNADGRLVTYGPLIHNNQVVELLKRRKVETVKEGDEIRPGDLAVIRAHGVPPDILQSIREKGASICDATCPHVKRAQNTVQKAVSEGASVIIVGDRGHAEVAGLLGHAGGNGYVVQSPEDVKKLPHMEFAWVVAQTTQASETFEEVARLVKEKADRVEVTKTICSSTANRQQEVVEMAKHVDLLVVVGGKHSANTIRLAEIARKCPVPTVHIETADDLDPEYLKQFRTAGVTAGASTPNWLIEEVAEKLKLSGSVSPWCDRLRRLLSFLVVSHLFLSAGAAATCIAMSTLLEASNTFLNATLAGLYIFSMQNLNMYLDHRHGELVTLRRHRFYDKYGRILAPVAAATALVSLILGLAAGKTPFALLALSTFLGGLYTVRILPAGWRYQRLKDLPGSKNIFFAIAFAVVAVLIPEATHGLNSLVNLSATASLAFLYVAILAVARSITLDIQTIQTDQFAGRETIPALIGKGHTNLLICTLLAACIILFSISRPGPQLLLCLATLLYAGAYILLSHLRVLRYGLAVEFVVDLSFYTPLVIPLAGYFGT